MQDIFAKSVSLISPFVCTTNVFPANTIYSAGVGWTQVDSASFMSAFNQSLFISVLAGVYQVRQCGVEVEHEYAL